MEGERLCGVERARWLGERVAPRAGTGKLLGGTRCTSIGAAQAARRSALPGAALFYSNSECSCRNRSRDFQFLPRSKNAGAVGSCVKFWRQGQGLKRPLLNCSNVQDSYRSLRRRGQEKGRKESMPFIHWSEFEISLFSSKAHPAASPPGKPLIRLG